MIYEILKVSAAYQAPSVRRAVFQRCACGTESGSAARAAGEFGCGDGPGTGGAGPHRARAQPLMDGTWHCGWCIHKGRVCRGA